MRKCYADTTLNISQDVFERPEKVSIRLDCDGKPKEKDSIKVKTPVIKAGDTDF